MLEARLGMVQTTSTNACRRKGRRTPASGLTRLMTAKKKQEREKGRGEREGGGGWAGEGQQAVHHMDWWVLGCYYNYEHTSLPAAPRSSTSGAGPECLGRWMPSPRRVSSLLGGLGMASSAARLVATEEQGASPLRL